MGRPRKYPRTEGSPAPQSFPSPLLVPTAPSVWDDPPPPGFGPQMPLPIPFMLANPAPPIIGTSHAWRAPGADLTTGLFDSSHLPPSAAPYHGGISDLPLLPETRHALHQLPAQNMNSLSYDHCDPAARHHYTPAEALLNVDSLATSSSGHQQPINHATAPLGFAFNTTTGFSYKESPSTQPSITQMRQEYNFSVNRGTNLTTNQEESQSPEGRFAPVIVFTKILPLIYGSDLDAIYLHFKGWALGSLTQYHLEFILHDRPNPGISDSTFQYPRLNNPSLYNTMVADVVSFMTCGKPSAPNIYEPISTPYESLFAQMLRCDRGGNEAVAGAPFLSFNPVEYHTVGELKAIYSHFQEGNPFRFLFMHVNVHHRGDYRTFDSALVATIVGWNLFERSKRHNQNLDASFPSSSSNHMPYFEFAEEELMKRPLWETQNFNSILSTVQALTLLGVFRTMDGQPRCGWALLSVAHLLARQAILQTQSGKCGIGNQKRARTQDNVEENQLNGLFWLLTLVRIWTGLSLRLPQDSLVSILRPGTSLPVCDQDHGWAGRLLLDAAQLLDVLSTLSREESAARLGSKTTLESEANVDFLGTWLAVIARRRCQLSRSDHTPHQTPELLSTLNVTSNPHANPTLAVTLSILALNKYHPFRQISFYEPHFPFLAPAPNTPEMLQIATTEAAGAVASGSLTNPTDALILRVLRGAFPYLVAILNGAILGLGVGNEIEHSRLESAVEFLSSFVEAGFSLYQREDQIVVERMRASLLACFPTPSILTCQAPIEVPCLESDHGQVMNNNPASLGLTTSYSNNTSSNSSSTTLTGGASGSKTGLNPPSSSESPVHVQRPTEISSFNTTYPAIGSYAPITNTYSSQPETIYDYEFLQDFQPSTSIQRQVSMDHTNLQKTDGSEMSRSSGSSPDF